MRAGINSGINPGAAIQPPVNFRMAIGKGNARRPVVKRSRPVNHLRGRGHGNRKRPIIDVVLVFIHEHPQIRWVGLQHVGKPAISPPRLVGQMMAGAVQPRPVHRRPDVRLGAHRLAHGIRPHMTAGIAWAFEDADGPSVVGSQQGLGEQGGVGGVGGIFHLALHPHVGAGVIRIGRQPAIGIVGIQVQGNHQLLAVVEAGNSLGLLLRGGKRGQQHRRQDGNDGNDHQQLDQSKPSVA